MEDHRMGRAPDYTTACIVMFGVNLAWVFLALWAIYGLAAVILTALALNHWMNWLESRRLAREKRWRKP